MCGQLNRKFYKFFQHTKPTEIRVFDKEKYLEGHFIKAFPENIRSKIAKQGIRNAVLLTQAPTGSTSLLAGVSSGIEPVFDFAMVRKDRIGEHVIYHPLFQEWKEAHPDEEVPGYFVAANDLTPDDHIKVQAMVQKYTDSSISKTVNAPNSHTVLDVNKLYMDAYKLGCKGVTYYRDGCRDAVLSHIEEKPKEPKSPYAHVGFYVFDNRVFEYSTIELTLNTANMIQSSQRASLNAKLKRVQFL